MALQLRFVGSTGVILPLHAGVNLIRRVARGGPTLLAENEHGLGTERTRPIAATDFAYRAVDGMSSRGQLILHVHADKSVTALVPTSAKSSSVLNFAPHRPAAKSEPGA